MTDGDKGIRTLDPLLARQVLSQLSYTPKKRMDCSLHSSTVFFINPGSRLLSRTVSSQVPSAAHVLTVVFGMGTGVAPGRIAARSFGLLDNPTVKHIRFTSSP